MSAVVPSLEIAKVKLLILGRCSYLARLPYINKSLCKLTHYITRHDHRSNNKLLDLMDPITRSVDMMLSRCIIFIFLFGCGLSYHAKKTRVIRGSSVDVFCPFGQATTAFEGAPLRSLDVTAPGRESNFDIQRGHLLIREVDRRHSGSIFCSKGREKVFVTRLLVIGKFPFALLVVNLGSKKVNDCFDKRTFLIASAR